MEARPGTIMKLLEALDAFRHPDLDSFVLACQADWQGRTGLQERPYPQGRRLREALAAARAVQAADLPGDITPGPELGEELRAARVEAIAELPVETTDQD